MMSILSITSTGIRNCRKKHKQTMLTNHTLPFDGLSPDVYFLMSFTSAMVFINIVVRYGVGVLLCGEGQLGVVD